MLSEYTSVISPVRKIYIIEIFVLVIFLIFGFFLYLDYSHKAELNEGVVNKEILKQVSDNLKASKPVELQFQENITGPSLVKDMATTTYTNYTEERLLDILNQEKSPSFLDNLIKDLVIKNNSTDTVESTCRGQDLLEKDECKKSLFIGCSEALYLNFALVTECLQFEKTDYVKYLKAKKVLVQSGKSMRIIEVNTELGKIIPSPLTFSKEELKDTIDSSVLNNDFTNRNEEEEKAELLAKEENREEISDIKIEVDIAKKDEEKNPEKVLKNLLTNVASVVVKYSGWVQGWATIFATNNGRAEAGFKMYKTTAFGYNPYQPKNCMVSLPYKTVDKFFGTSLNYCVRQGLVECVLGEKQKVKGNLIEVLMIKNGKSAIFPLGDLGPAEWTGNALDLNGCAAKKLSGTGKDQVRFRVAR